MTEFTVTHDGGDIIVHEGDHHSPSVAVFTGIEGEDLFDMLLAGAVATGKATFWDANRAEYLT